MESLPAGVGQLQRYKGYKYGNFTYQTQLNAVNLGYGLFLCRYDKTLKL
jgi:hypothetical protein